MRASRQEHEPGPAHGGAMSTMAQVWGSQRGFRWKINTVTQLYTQGFQGHSKEEIVPKKVKVEQQSRGEPSGELPEPGRRAERWENQGEVVSEDRERGHQWLKLRGQGSGLRKPTERKPHSWPWGPGQELPGIPQKSLNKGPKPHARGIMLDL